MVLPFRLKKKLTKKKKKEEKKKKKTEKQGSEIVAPSIFPRGGRKLGKGFPGQKTYFLLKPLKSQKQEAGNVFWKAKGHRPHQRGL